MHALDMKHSVFFPSNIFVEEILVWNLFGIPAHYIIVEDCWK